MSLFPIARTINLLPRDGEVNYLETVLTAAESDYYFLHLLHQLPWQHDEVVIFGKKIITPRKTAWFGDRNFAYRYSNTTKLALPWTDDLLFIKRLVEQQSAETYNSCLLNLYHNGSEGMSWHSDNEPELKANGTIASLSLGAARVFHFKHKQTKETLKIHLEHGSLLLMKGEIQKHWLHRLPVAKQINQPRINLTFRTITG